MLRQATTSEHFFVVFRELRLSVARFFPVSYTHLDVYKRQAIVNARPNEADRRIKIRSLLTCESDHGAVSYTHLDVYKRQAFTVLLLPLPASPYKRTLLHGSPFKRAFAVLQKMRRGLRIKSLYTKTARKITIITFYK